VIVQVPDFGDRFWTYQVADGAHGLVLLPGQAIPYEAGVLSLVGPNWKGEVPPGVTATCRSSTVSQQRPPRRAPEETRYIYTDFDSAGERLNGAHGYTVTFPKDQTPPVNGFWSLTLYNEEHLFAPSPLNRYSLGTKNRSMQRAADGSLTLYVQSGSPGSDKESNWLPAPKGADFSLYIRAYWPKPRSSTESGRHPRSRRRVDAIDFYSRAFAHPGSCSAPAPRRTKPR
jgi:hypothetical protein